MKLQKSDYRFTDDFIDQYFGADLRAFIKYAIVFAGLWLLSSAALSAQDVQLRVYAPAVAPGSV